MNGNQSPNQVYQLRSWSHQQIARLRVGVGIWLLLLTAILYGASVGGPCGSCCSLGPRRCTSGSHTACFESQRTIRMQA